MDTESSENVEICKKLTHIAGSVLHGVETYNVANILSNSLLSVFCQVIQDSPESGPLFCREVLILIEEHLDKHIKSHRR
jgi:hypothetical protein